nr:hypothetical protein [Bacteroides acidifaciens]
MMKLVYKLHFLLGGILLWTGCTEEHLHDKLFSETNGRIVLALNTVAGDIEESGSLTRAKEMKESIAQMKYIIYDSDGQVINHLKQTLAPDYSTLTLEGLKGGMYSIAFLATTNEDEEAFQPLSSGNGYLLMNPSAESPVNEDYLYARTSFEIGKGQGSRTINVLLTRCVGRVEINVKAAPYTDYMIKKIEISLDGDDELYLSKTAGVDDSYGGSGTIKLFDVSNDRAFYSFPSKAPVSGTVTIESVQEDNTPVHNVYRFSDVVIEEGKVTGINIDWESPNGNKGFFRVFESDYTEANSDTMFLNNEPLSVLYNSTLRSFSTDEPLQAKINNNHELQLNFFSPVDIHDVTILCRLKKYSNEFFKFAHFETIPGFSELRMYVPLLDRALAYTLEDGRNIVIPAQPGLSEKDCELIIETSHPYMEKIATITHPIKISFSGYSADSESPYYWIHMTPELCRQGCVLGVNLSFLYNSQDFVDAVVNWNRAPFTGNDGKPITPEEVIKKARGVQNLVMGNVKEGEIGGLGGGSTFGLGRRSYIYQYWHTAPMYDPVKIAIYHEFGHCMGYSHDSSMTYGGAWTALSEELVYELGRAGRLPVSNSGWASNYP